MEVALTLLALTGMGLSIAMALRDERREQERLTRLSERLAGRRHAGPRSI